MLKILNGINTAFKRHPLIMNCLIYGGLYVGAEYSQQFFTKKILVNESKAITIDKRRLAITPNAVIDNRDQDDDDDDDDEDIDYQTLGRYAVMGTFIYAPTLYTWYKWLDGKYPGTNRKIIVKKLLLDQFLLTPYLLTIFYTGMAIMEGSENIFEELNKKFLPTFERSCLFWLPVQFCNFAVIPPKYRVIYMGVCGFIWINILCWTKRQTITN